MLGCWSVELLEYVGGLGGLKHGSVQLEECIDLHNVEVELQKDSASESHSTNPLRVIK